MTGIQTGSKVFVKDVEHRTRTDYVHSITSHHLTLSDGFGHDKGTWEWGRIIELRKVQ